jgi:hypothetical protein
MPENNGLQGIAACLMDDRNVSEGHRYRTVDPVAAGLRAALPRKPNRKTEERTFA